MKLISLLIALLLVGYLAVKQLNSTSSNREIDDTETPRAPSSPEELEDFKEDMSQLLQDNADARVRKLEESSEN